MKQFLDQTALEDNCVQLEMQADCLLILSCLCELNGHRKVLSQYYKITIIFVSHRNCLVDTMVSMC